MHVQNAKCTDNITEFWPQKPQVCIDLSSVDNETPSEKYIIEEVILDNKSNTLGIAVLPVIGCVVNTEARQFRDTVSSNV